jgi:HEAT repeat protein
VVFGKTGGGGEHITGAARAAADLKLDSLSEDVLNAFFKLRADSKEGGSSYRDYNEAMVKLAAKSWSPRLIEALSVPMELPQPGSEQNKEKITDFRNQQFWQTTAAQLLGEIGDPAAVEPLIKVVLDPPKANIAATAVLALVKIGKPAADRAAKLISGQDKALSDFALERAKKTNPGNPSPDPDVRSAAVILGTIGNPSAATAMVDALKKAKSEDTRAVITRELAKLPATEPVLAAFKEGYESLSPDAVIPPGAPAQPVLAESAATFFDPELIPWLIAEAKGAKGDEDVKKGTQAAITVSVIKLARSQDLDAVKGAVQSYGTQLERDVFKQAEGLLNTCKGKVECYLTEIEKDGSQDKKGQFIGIKAAYMIGILGNEGTRDELVKKFAGIYNPAVRFTAVMAIDHLSPKGSAAAADELQKLVDANVKTADPEKIAGDAPVKQVIYRLRSRAQS